MSPKYYIKKISSWWKFLNNKYYKYMLLLLVLFQIKRLSRLENFEEQKHDKIPRLGIYFSYFYNYVF